MLEDGSVRVRADDLYVGVHLLQITAGAAYRAAGPDTGDEVRDLAVRVAPNLGSGRPVMSGRISGMVILVRIKRIRRFFCDTPRGFMIVLRRPRLGRCRHDYHVRSHALQIPNFLHRDLVRQNKDALVAANSRCQRQANARVPGRCLDDRAAFLQNALFLSPIDHRNTDPILD